MSWSDDPLRDFARHDAESEEEAANLPKCDCCLEPIFDDFYWEIDGEKYCENCLNENFRRAN